jgi:ribosomal-protein-alanine N-acetyltransferase
LTAISAETPYTIHPASWLDLAAVRQVEQVCFPKDAWPIWDMVAVLTLPDIVRLKALVGNRLVGFIAGDIRRIERLGWITTLAVLPAYRRKGIAQALLETCEQKINLPRVRLCVRRSNSAAIALYQQAGYRQAGVWPAYYHDGEDALVLEKRVASPPAGKPG